MSGADGTWHGEAHGVDERDRDRGDGGGRASGYDDDVHVLAAAHALDALDDAERRRFEAHLPGCAACRADVAEFGDTAALLGEAAAAPPPASLRTSLLAAVARTPQEPATSTAPSSTARPGPAGAPAVADLAAHRATRTARDRRRTPRWQSGLAAACALLAAGTGTWAWSAQRSAEEARSAATAADREADRMAALLTAPGSRVRTVAGTGGATATVVSAGHEAVVVGAGMPAVASDRGYQLWLIEDGAARPAGMLHHDEDGHWSAYVPDTGGAPTLGVTEEPAGGSEQPTTTPLLAADLTA